MGSAAVGHSQLLDGKKSVNQYFYKLWLPIQVLTVLAFFGIIFNVISVNWWQVLIAWFLIGPVGTGVGLHRLFAHRQFETYRPVEIALAVLGTFSAYGPIMYWVAQHQHHHKHADHDEDINTPGKGFWHSFLYWRFSEKATKKVDIRNYCSLRAARDPVIMKLSTYFTPIIYLVMLILLVIDINWLVSLFLIPVFIEQIRVNVLNSLAHMNLPGSYRLFDSDDTSYNNIFLGWLTFGFGWHNAHHANPRELINTHRWWELDVEGIIGKLLSRRTQ